MPIILRNMGTRYMPRPLRDIKIVLNLVVRKHLKKKKITAEFADVYHYWGVFHKNRLIAYSSNIVYDDEAVDYSAIKFIPEYLKLYPAYALVYTMNQYYLKEQSCLYVNDGFRSISHQSDIQDFLIKKFWFKKAYTGINIVYKPILSLYLSITYPYREIMGRLSAKLKTLYLMEEIHRKGQLNQNRISN